MRVVFYIGGRKYFFFTSLISYDTGPLHVAPYTDVRSLVKLLVLLEIHSGDGRGES